MNWRFRSHLSRRRFLRSFVGTLGASAMLRLADAAEPAWIERAEYGPFQCVSAFPLAPLGATFAELTQLERELQRTLAAPPMSSRVEILLLADEASYRRYMHELYPRVPYRRALYVKRGGRGAVYAFWHDQLPIDLRHECTHALLHASLPEVPLWLDEGLAEYFEMPQSERAFGHPHLAAVRRHTRLGFVRTVDSLENIHDLAAMGGMEYRFSWAWVHFMLHGPVAAHRSLVAQMARIRRGENPGSLADRLQAAVPELDHRMIQHFRSWQRA
jgi:hypothetical protein